MRQLILGLLIIAFAPFTQAQPDYFSAQVPVASQNNADRQKALQLALSDVLVKVSGSLDAPNSELAQKSLSNAGRYVLQYRYLKAEPVLREQGINLLLKADFDQGLVRKLLKDSGRGVWPTNRPDVLIYAIEDTPEAGRQIITDPNHPFIAGLIERAKQRGLPVLLPLWDLDDQLMLSSEQLWSLNDEAIMAASARYDVNTVLVARYSQSSTQVWFATWQFHHADEIRSYDLTTKDDQLLGATGVDPLVDFLANRYAVQGALEDGELLQMVELDGIASYPSYEAALEYIAKQPLVSQVNLVGVRGTTLDLQIMLSGTWPQLIDALALDKKMRYVGDASSQQMNTSLGTSLMPAQFVWLDR